MPKRWARLSLSQELQNGASLCLEGGTDSEHPSDKLAARLGLRAKTSEPPNHCRTECALSRIVCGFDSRGLDKCPEGRFHFQELSTSANGFGQGGFLMCGNWKLGRLF